MTDEKKPGHEEDNLLPLLLVCPPLGIGALIGDSMAKTEQNLREARRALDEFHRDDDYKVFVPKSVEMREGTFRKRHLVGALIGFLSSVSILVQIYYFPFSLTGTVVEILVYLFFLLVGGGISFGWCDYIDKRTNKKREPPYFAGYTSGGWTEYSPYPTIAGFFLGFFAIVPITVMLLIAAAYIIGIAEYFGYPLLPKQ